MINYEIKSLLKAYSLPQRSGVYAVIAKSQLLYVGSTCNLSSWSNGTYLLNEIYARYDFSDIRIWVIYCPIQLMETVKTELINRYKPIFNRVKK